MLRRQGLAGIAPDALDHGPESVGALRRQMFAQAEADEPLRRIDLGDVACRAVAIERQRQIDQPFDDMGIAVAAKPQDRLAIGPADFGFEPNLAGASLDPVDLVMGRFGERVQLPSKLDQVAISLAPIIQKREICSNVFDVEHDDPELEESNVLS